MAVSIDLTVAIAANVISAAIVGIFVHVRNRIKVKKENDESGEFFVKLIVEHQAKKLALNLVVSKSANEQLNAYKEVLNAYDKGIEKLLESNAPVFRGARAKILKK